MTNLTTQLATAQAQLLTLNTKLSLTQVLLSGVQREMENFEVDRDLKESDLETALNECSDEPEIELFGMSYNKVDALKELDPTAWRCMVSDHECEKSIDPEFVELEEKEGEIEDDILELETEIEDLELDIEELEAQIKDQ